MWTQICPEQPKVVDPNRQQVRRKILKKYRKQGSWKIDPNLGPAIFGSPVATCVDWKIPKRKGPNIWVPKTNKIWFRIWVPIWVPIWFPIWVPFGSHLGLIWIPFGSLFGSQFGSLLGSLFASQIVSIMCNATMEALVFVRYVLWKDHSLINLLTSTRRRVLIRGNVLMNLNM